MPNYYKYKGHCCLVAYFPLKPSIQSPSSPSKPHLSTGAGLISRCHAHTTRNLHAPGGIRKSIEDGWDRIWYINHETGRHVFFGSRKNVACLDLVVSSFLRIWNLTSSAQQSVILHPYHFVVFFFRLQDVTDTGWQTKGKLRLKLVEKNKKDHRCKI